MKDNFAYTVTAIGNGIHLINEYFSTMFVIEGTERALVIDCGTGVGDFKRVVESITALPYDLVATHGHVDHIGGRGQFDKLYISETDSKVIKSVTMAYRRLYALSCFLTNNNAPRKNIHFTKVKSEPQVCTVKEGTVFDLGGRTVTVIETPGHTNGSICLLDSKDKILFSGDVANPFLFMWLSNCTTIKGVLPTLERLYKLDGYETVWASHALTPLSREDIGKCLSAAKKLSEKRNSLLPVIKRFIDGSNTIIYRATRIK